MASTEKEQDTAGKPRATPVKEREGAPQERQKDEEKRRKEEVTLLKPAQMQKIPFSVDPKTTPFALCNPGVLREHRQ